MNLPPVPKYIKIMPVHKKVEVDEPQLFDANTMVTKPEPIPAEKVPDVPVEPSMIPKWYTSAEPNEHI